MDSSLCEKPERHVPRRLSDHLTFEGQKQKVHSLVDKVYSRKNLTLAWERVRANQGAGGTDGVTIGEFEADLDANLERLHRELRETTYRPQAVRRLEIPKRGAPGKTRPLGIPSVYDRVCQQALVNRLEPIFEKVFDPSSFGYRKGRKTADALAKIWREVEAGNEWIVDADLKDYFGSVDHEKLMAPRKANRRQRRVEAHSTDAEGGLRGKGSAIRDSTRNPARRRRLANAEQYPVDPLR
jgi:RNA-directed DNA polymerase